MARFTPTRVARLPAQTALMRRVASQDELATLLERVLAVGLMLNAGARATGRLTCADATPRVAGQRTVHRAYEVRVDGQLDEATPPLPALEPPPPA